jgi:hypothetical protein
MKIIKHAREVALSSATSPASGQLLGIDNAGVLNVSDAFPLPSGSLGSNAEGEDKQASQKSSPSNLTPTSFFQYLGSVLIPALFLNHQLPGILPRSYLVYRHWVRMPTWSVSTVPPSMDSIVPPPGSSKL